MFYGPTGTGKTSIGVPLAQTTGSKFIQKGRIPRNTDVEALYHWLQSKAEEAEKLYKEKGRHTIIQINERAISVMQLHNKLNNSIHL